VHSLEAGSNFPAHKKESASDTRRLFFAKSKKARKQGIPGWRVFFCNNASPACFLMQTPVALASRLSGLLQNSALPFKNLKKAQNTIKMK